MQRLWKTFNDKPMKGAALLRGSGLPRYLLAGVWLLAMAATVLADEEPVTVRVFSLPTKGATSPTDLAEYQVLQHFLRTHPHIRLQAASTLQIEGAGMDAAPLMAIAGGTSPDIIAVNFRQSDTYIRQGFLLPLDDYIRQLSPEELKERMPESIVPVVRRPGPGGEVHYWALPEELLVTVLMYRKDLFAQAGLDPNQPPRDWKEFEEYARAIADPGAERYGMYFQTGRAAAYDIFPFLLAAGAEAMKQDTKGEWKAVFNSPEAITGYTFADHLRKARVTKDGKEGPVAYVGSDAGTQVRQGRVGMYFDMLGKTSIFNFEPDATAIAGVPKGPGGGFRTQVNADMLGIYAGVKDPRVRDAAWEYIKFATGREARRVFTESMVASGAAQLLNPSWLREFGFEDLAQTATPGLIELYEEAVHNGIPEPYGKNCQFIYDFMSRPLEKLFYTDMEGIDAAERERIVGNYLTEAVRETNERMLDQVPPPLRKKRNQTALAVVTVLAVAFTGFIIYVFKVIAPRPAGGAPGSRRKGVSPLVFIFPALLLILTWQYYPLLRGLLMAFQDYNIMGGSPWVGLDNFADVLFDSRFWLALKNAFYFCSLWIALGFLPPVLLAVILQEIPIGSLLFRILYYIPAVVSGVVILFMWRAIYEPSPDGILNHLLSMIHIPAQTWLQDPNLAMLCVVFPLAWANLGPGSLIYLAALKGIPDDLYEAADIDGANFAKKVFCIVIPYLRPLLVINVVGATILGFRSGDAVLAMTGGGPNGATQVIGYEIWQRSFLFLKFGQATAMAWLLGLLLLAFTAYQMRLLARVEFRTTT